MFSWVMKCLNGFEILLLTIACQFLYCNMIQCKPDISWSCISRNWIYRGRMLDPIFLPTDFANFADVAPKSAIFFAKSR